MCEIVAVPSPSAAIPGTYGDELSALDPSTWAVAALIEEAELTPKPALVDRRGNGAHHDLDLERLRLSAGALRDGFAAMARAASGGSVARWSDGCWRLPMAATPTEARSGHSDCWSPPPGVVRIGIRRASRPPRPRSRGCRTDLHPAR